jgi:hypothetical protein
MTPEQIQEISRLRSLNLSPKQIARNLKLRPAEVTAIIRDRAAQLEQDRAERGEVAPLYNCLVNHSVAKVLTANAPKFKGNVNGFAQVFVARTDRHPDFTQAKPHLGLRSDPLIPIEFGKDGKPYYINGPYDRPDSIIAKLNQSVGKGNYDYLIGAGD